LRAETRSGQLRLAGLRHPFRWGSRARIVTTDDLAAPLREVLHLTSVAALVPIRQSSHQFTIDAIGRLRLVAWLGTAIEIVAEAPGTPTLYLLHGGRMEVRSAGQTLRAQGGDLLFLPAAPYRATTSSCALIALRPDPADLGASLQSVLGRSLPQQEQARMLAQSFVVHADDGPERRDLARALGSLLQMFEQLHGVDEQLPEILDVDHQLHQLIAALLLADHPGLDRLLPAQERRMQGEEAFEDLLDYLRTHLASSLSLPVLERQSGLSRRALQYLFQHRFGCTPMQWVRRERLELARYQLEHAGPEDSVWSIAVSCGYRSPSHFSADFQRQFHRKPSELLRRKPPAIPHNGKSPT